MTGKFFLDTNFLVYCFSKDEPEKRQRCLSLLQEVKGTASIVLSTQVLKEFAAVMIGKLKQPPLEVKGIIQDLILFEVVDIDADCILEAIDLQMLYSFSFWDSLIVSAAKRAHCHTIWTEDLQHNRIVAGVRIENPFIDTRL